MKLKALYINCDLGEGFPRDRELMRLVNQVNIACGGHAGSLQTLVETLKEACDHSCAVGAHPGYADRLNFGRRSLSLGENELKTQLRKQLDVFADAVERTSSSWHHVKPHGALYHDIAREEEVGEWFIEVLQEYPVGVLFLDTSSAAAAKSERHGIRVWKEAFLDRGYDEQGKLLPRTDPGALLTNKEDARIQCEGFLSENRAETYCIHGDHASSLKILRHLHTFFPTWGYQLVK